MTTTSYSHAQSLGTHSANHQRQRLQVVLAYRALRARLHARSTTHSLSGATVVPQHPCSRSAHSSLHEPTSYITVPHNSCSYRPTPNLQPTMDRVHQQRFIASYPTEVRPCKIIGHSLSQSPSPTLSSRAGFSCLTSSTTYSLYYTLAQWCDTFQSCHNTHAVDQHHRAFKSCWLLVTHELYCVRTQ